MCSSYVLFFMHTHILSLLQRKIAREANLELSVAEVYRLHNAWY